MDKVLSYIGLAMRAGKITSGDEGVLKAIQSSEAQLVFLAKDASENTRKKFHDKCKSYRIPLLEKYSRDELGRSIGKEQRVVIALNDLGFKKAILKCESNFSGGEEY